MSNRGPFAIGRTWLRLADLIVRAIDARLARCERKQ